jgi:hypothetical protein
MWRWAAGALFGLLVLLAVAGSAKVRQSLWSDARFHLANWDLDVGELPDWVTPEIRDDLVGVSLGAEDERLSLFEPRVLDKVRAALEELSWIAAVKTIGIRYPTGKKPGSVVLELQLRRPVAVVAHAGFYYLSDRNGMRLGHGYDRSPAAWFAVPEIVGLQGDPGVPAEGESWTSRDVKQGLEVARILMENGIHADFPRRAIRAVDLTNLHGRVSLRESEIVLWCEGQQLAWGRSPISAGARTVSLSQLVANLRHVLSHPEAYGGLALIHLHRKAERLTGRSVDRG